MEKRIRNLAELVKQFLRSDMSGREVLALTRRYAPRDFTENEIRQAALLALQLRGDTGNMALRALSQPEVLKPEVDASDLPRQGTIRSVLRAVGAPLRGVVSAVGAGLARLFGERETGYESGEPARITPSLVENYVQDLTFGSLLEGYTPAVPRGIRITLGGLLDYGLDPLGWFGFRVPVREVVKKATQRVARTGTRAAAESGTRTAGRVAKAVEHVGRALTRERALPQPIASRLNRLADEIAYQWARVIDPTLAKTAREIHTLTGESQGAVQSALEKTRTATQRLVSNFWGNAGTPEDWGKFLAESATLPEDAKFLNRFLAQLEQRKRYSFGELLRKAENEFERERLVRLFENTVRNFSRLANRQESAVRFPITVRDISERGTEIIRQKVGENLNRFTDTVIRHTIRDLDAPWWRKIPVVWSQSKTVWNPPTHIRNFVQNFVFRWLTGDIDLKDLARGTYLFARYRFGKPREGIDEFVNLGEGWLSRLLGIRGSVPLGAEFGSLYSQGGYKFTPIGLIPQESAYGAGGNLLQRAYRTALRIYDKGDEIPAAIMELGRLASGKPMKEMRLDYSLIPERLQWLRRAGLIPFLGWQYHAGRLLIPSLLRQPQRHMVFGRAVERGSRQETEHGVVQDDSVFLRQAIPVKGTGRALSLPTLYPLDPQLGLNLLDPRRIVWVDIATNLSEDPIRGWARSFLPSFAVYTTPRVLQKATTGVPLEEAQRLVQRGEQPLTAKEEALKLLGIGIRPYSPLASRQAKIRETQKRLQEELRMRRSWADYLGVLIDRASRAIKEATQ